MTKGNGTTTQRAGKVRTHKGTLELSAYAGVNPATGRAHRLYEYLPVGTPEKEIGRRLRALVVKAEELAATRRLRRKEGGHALPPEPPTGRHERTVRHALETWWQAHACTLARASDIRWAIDTYLLPHLGDVALWRLRGAIDADEAERDPDLLDLSAFLRGLKSLDTGDRLGLNTTHKLRRYLSAALTLAVRKGWMPANPCAEVTLEGLGERDSTTPEPDELAAFLPFLAGDRELPAYTVSRRSRLGNPVTYTVPARRREATDADHQLLTFAMFVASGPRPEEVAAIRRGQLDTATGRLSLTGAGVIRVKGDDGRERWELRQGETHKRRKRNITLDPGTLDLARELIRRQDTVALAHGVRRGRRSYLFSLDPAGATPLTPGAASQGFHRAVEAAITAGVDMPEGMRLYDMRHFGITQLLEQGRSPKRVAHRFGTSEQMIWERYSHAIGGDDDQLAETLGEVSAGLLAGVLRPTADGTVTPLRR